MISLRLASRQWMQQPLRPILCALAIAAAVALVVCVGISFDSLRASFRAGVSSLLGQVELHVRPAQHNTSRHLTPAMVDMLRARPDIAVVSPRLSGQVFLDTPGEHRLFEAVGVEVEPEQMLRPKRLAEGTYFTGKPGEILIDRSIAEALKLSAGDALRVSTDAGTSRPATVVGVIERPRMPMFDKPILYLPIKELAADLQQEVSYTALDLKLTNPDTDFQAYAAALQEDLGPAVQVKPAMTRQSQMSRETGALNVALLALSIISGTCAALIIGTTLSVGVQERIRQFGQLRCIGASRKQLISILAADAAILMVSGITLGLLLGALLAWVITLLYPALFVTYEIAPSSLVIAAANGAFATMLGALIPAWQIARVSPMEAVRVAATPSRARRVYRVAMIGIGLLVVQLLAWFLVPDLDIRLMIYTSVGIPMVFLGYCLLGPALLLLAERFAARLMGGVFAIRPALLRNAWSRTPWRAGAMVAALMIGVILFTSVRQRMNSLTQVFETEARLPDMFFYSIKSVPNKRIDAIKAKVPGIAEDMVFTTTPVGLRTPILGRLGMPPMNATIFAGIQPQKFRSMFNLNFVEGDPDQTFALLEQGGHVLVAREYKVARGVSLGDTVSLMSADGKPVEFKVAGVVTSVVLDKAMNYFDAKTTVSTFAASSVMGNLKDAEKYFGIQGVNALAVNLKEPQQATELINSLRPTLTAYGMEAVSSVEMKSFYTATLERVGNGASLIAAAAMLIASLGVANMVIASIRARRFEFGVLRAIGAGRSQLLRLVLAEVTLISLTAALLGTLGGLHYAFMGKQLDRDIIGLLTSFLTTPADYQTLGITASISIAVTVTLGILAASGPAWRAANSAQRAILAQGRA